MRRRLQVVVSGMAVVGVLLVAAPMAQAQEPTAAAPAPPVLTLDGDAAIITILIKPDKTADFEAVLAKLKESLAKSDKPERKQQAAGWKVFKSPTQAASPSGPSAVYIFLISPVVKGQEYDLTRIIAEVFPVEVQEVFAKYKDAFAGRAINTLNQFMSMQ
jgi:hypothetical protein